MRTKTSDGRGQAMVELAIGSTLFVTLTLFAIHFSEVGFLSLKVQEAATSALWDSTAGKLHDIPMTVLGGEYSNSIAVTAAARATVRYQNFDGRTSKIGMPEMAQLFTQGNGLTVTCTTGGAAGLGYGGLFLTTATGVYIDNGGLQCSAQADIDSLNLPTHFLEGGNGFFQGHTQNATPSIRVCSTGRSLSGCTGKTTMMLDDWGMADQSKIQCLMISDAIPFVPPLLAGVCTNIPFMYAVALPYLVTALPIPPGGQLMVPAMLGFPSPIVDDAPFLSAVGEELDFIQPLLGEQGGGYQLQFWPTSPGSALNFFSPWNFISHTTRIGNGRCFLGKPC